MYLHEVILKILKMFCFVVVMGSSYQLIALLCFCLVHVCSAGNCLCSDHNELPIYTCDDGKTAPFGFLYYDGLGSHCLVEVSGLHAKQGWKAGLFVYKETVNINKIYKRRDICCM